MKKIIKGLFIVLFGLLISIVDPNELLAASASVNVSSSSSKIVVGKTFTVTIKISSSKALGSWDLFPSYDTSKFKLISGKSHIAGFADNKNTKSVKYTYTFKAISTGSGKISAKINYIYGFDEKQMSVSTSSKTVSVITQSQLEASYSKNNDLKSLKVEGLTLSPKFDDDTLKYTVNAGANTNSIVIKATAEDSRSKISGTGKKNVSEGENKFKIVVTAQNGSTKTYTLIVNVTDPNPIEVVINDKKYTIVKRAANIEKVEDFVSKTITINKQSIPALFNKDNNLTLVGLKDSEGDINLFIYNEEDNSYKPFNDITLSKMRILPLSMDKKIDDYKNETIQIDEISVEALNVNDHIYIIKAKDLNTTEEDYYFYDKDNNTVIKYYEGEKDNSPIIIKNDVTHYKRMIMVLGIETVVIIFILICILIRKVNRNKRKREYLQRKIEEEKKRLEEVEQLKSEIKNLESKNKSSKSKTKKKEVSKDEVKKKK